MLPPLDPGRLKAANINPATGLATDYLNHYNEIAMTIANLGVLPEMREAVLDWRPVAYAAHFIRTRYADGGLAVAGYITAPRDVKAQFLAARDSLDARLADLQRRLESDDGSAEALSAEADAIFADIARLGGIINGGQSASLLERSAEQALVDSLFP